MELILIRHMKAENNVKKIYKFKEAHILPDNNIKSFLGLKEVYVSSYQRSIDTAKVLFPDCENIIVDSLLDELDFSLFNMKSYDEVKKKYWYEMNELFSNSFNHNVKGLENLNDVKKRYQSFLEKIRNKNRVVAITHDAIFRMAFCDIVGDDNYSKINSTYLSNLCIEYQKDYKLIKNINGDLYEMLK